MLSSCRSQYEVSDDTDSVQMLQRSTQVGEFYRMSAPKTWDRSKNAGKLPPHYMDIIIYDEEMDKHVHITLDQAYNAAVPEGIDPIAASANGSKAANLFGTADQVEQAYDSVAGPGVTKKGAAQGASFITDAKAGDWAPLEIIIARPFIEHLMMSAIMAVSGRDTGATLFGPADMQISANTSVKTIEGHYTYVFKPRTLPCDFSCASFVLTLLFLCPPSQVPHQVRDHQAAERARPP